MARRNTEEMLRKQKEAKQKKLLILLIPLFLGLVAWQGPKMYKAFLGPKPEATPPPAATTPAPTDPAAPPTTTTAGGETTPPPSELVDTDVPPRPGRDRLVSFSRFQSRDPFGRPASAAGTSAAPDADSGDDGEQAATSANFEVNGVAESVTVNGQFPASDPTFVLVSLTGDGAVLGLVGGSFEGGESTVQVGVGEQVEIVADPDGTHYVVELVSIGPA
jgi:hypothetical protein